ncbi:MAG: hypothetical protein P0Y53_17310 [Candidatus Pseudobacter hemicellulosilyticus]|uniref:Uncharacterized protein n=1 Tax=Candidatus Pseudobacter hemicellulosilyticus TaxID=3121375 RepID=A0AAJ6BEP1_9BACT|nr:MAG: hypothetical protein P0Y53_17310 [Pseudobacter sp.]
MRKYILISVLFAGALFSNGCSKSDELVPANKSVLREYVLPPASFMTPDERAVIDERRDEYNSIL